MKNELIAMILAGGKGTRLQALTRKHAKPAVFFGGKYRIIDFVLSNCANSGIRHVGVITQYENSSLNNYIGSGRHWGLNGINSSTALLSPRQTEEGNAWFKGTADAIYENIDYIDSLNPEYVLILSGDHIYSTTYDAMLECHKKNEADCTISVLEVPMEEASRFGILETDETGRVTEFKEKPKQPKSNLASMGVYIFTWKVLKALLIRDAKNEASSHDFGHDVIPYMLAHRRRIFTHRFKGYWKDVGTIASLHSANMDLLESGNPEMNLLGTSNRFPVYSEDTHSVPQFIGKNAVVKNSLINQGAVVLGRVERCVVSSDVYVDEGAIVKSTVLMPGCHIGKGAHVEYAIVGPDATVTKDDQVIGKEDNITLYTGKGKA